MADILIIGAGAAGLMAGRELAQQGRKVLILEARDRIGGRIHTVQLPGFAREAELGAEFVHGLLPLTLKLLMDAGIDTQTVGGSSYKRTVRGLERQEDMIEGWEELVRKASLLERDTSLDEFLNRYFSGAGYAELRQSVKRFTEGYDAADSSMASVFNLRKEWEGEQEEQYRVAGGYLPLLNFLCRQLAEAGGILHLNSPVTELRWSKGWVEAKTADGCRYCAGKLICTVPIGVLQAAPGQEGSIRFSPALPPEIAEAIGNIGYGPVIKFLFRFRTPLGEKDSLWSQIPRDLGFLFSQETIPTWWTRFPDTEPLLTGWLSGPAALPWRDAPDEELLELACGCLCRIFSLEREQLEAQISGRTVYNWLRDPYARGAYSYAYPDSERARKLLNKQPVEQTIYFAGEGYNRGNAPGTVDAALTSGLKVAELILKG